MLPIPPGSRRQIPIHLPNAPTLPSFVPTSSIFGRCWWLVVAIGLASVAAYFSVTGMTRIFDGASIAIIAMASMMEGGKLIGAVWVCRHWRTTNWLQARMIRTWARTNAAWTCSKSEPATPSRPRPHARPSASSASGTRGTQRAAIFGTIQPIVLRLPRNAPGYGSTVQPAGKLVRLIWASLTPIVVCEDRKSDSGVGSMQGFAQPAWHSQGSKGCSSLPRSSQDDVG
jgi:hypothetical protein